LVFRQAANFRWRNFTWVPVAVDIALEVAGIAGVLFFVGVFKITD
jgi:hypothetical protein